MFSSVFRMWVKRIAWVIGLLVSLTACDNDKVGSVTQTSDGGSQVEMLPPQKIALARNVDPNALFVEVTVNSVPVSMQTNSDGVRVGNIRLVAGTNQTVKVRWLENYEGAPLELAVAEQDIRVTRDATGRQEVTFRSNQFDFTRDLDQDSISNFDERVALTDPRDAGSPEQVPPPVPVTVRIQLPDDRILNDSTLLASVTPVAVVNNQELVLTRDGNSWSGATSATQGSNAFTSVTFFQNENRGLVLATAKFNQDVGTGTEFLFVSSVFDTGPNQDNDNLSNLDELLQGHDPFDSNSPVQDPCDAGAFALGCDIDSDEDGKPDSQETETADSDQDGKPNYQESSLQDNDGDDRNAELDSDDEDPCVPSSNHAACIQQQTDTDNDGKTDIAEGTGDTDGDGIPDFEESAILDEDADGVFDEADIDNLDPCIPSTTNAACRDQTRDTDGDGKTDVAEGTVDSDNDGIPDFRESSILDDDEDGVFDEADIDNDDPCVPSMTNAACRDQTRDTDGDGKTDVEEGTVDTDNDGIPDFRESSILDADDDGAFDEEDFNNTNPCVPSRLNEACEAIQLDTDMDGKTDVEEGTVDTDNDGIPDFRESAILDDDDDGVFDEEDIDNVDPCVPAMQNDACEAMQLDTDMDGKTDLEEGTVDTDGDGVPDFRESAILDDDDDGVFDEEDIDNDDPCIPSDTSAACLAVDTDGDTIPDISDNCRLIPNTNQLNTDGDLQGDACDLDDDGDGIPDATDNCKLIVNVDQANNDADTLGDLCDPDDDNDGVPDTRDNCQFVANPVQDPAACAVD